MLRKLLYFCAVCALSSFMLNCPSPMDSGGNPTPTPAAGPTPVPTASALWQTRIGAGEYDYGNGITSSTNSIVAGYVTGNVDYDNDLDNSDPGEDATNYGGWDVMLSAYNPSNGNWLWAKRLGTTFSDVAYAVASDSEYIVVAGAIGGDDTAGDADLNGDGDMDDPDPSGEIRGAIYVPSSGSNDIFISVFDTSGVFKWSRRLGGASFDSARSVCVFTIGVDHYACVTGYVIGDADLNGDGDTSDTSPSGESGSGYDDADAFISVFNLAGSGTFQWSRRIGGADPALGDYGNGIMADSSGNLALTGSIIANVDINGDTIIGGAVTGETGGFGGDDIFISVFNSLGTHLWARRLGGTSSDSGKSIAIDNQDHILVTGVTNGNADLSGDGLISEQGESGTNYGGEDIFITEFSSNNLWMWSSRLGGTNADAGIGVTADSARNIIVTGSVNGTADLNGDGVRGDLAIPGESSTYGLDDAIVSVFDELGSYRWSVRIGGTSSDAGRGVFAIGSGNILVAGITSGDADLNGDGNMSGPGESSTGFGNNDAFIVNFVQP